MFDWSTGDLYEGMRCFREGLFFEAHEHWEAVWLKSQEPEKTFLQALIQSAGALFHFRRGNLGGARSMMRKALQRLEGYPEIFGGVAVERFRNDARGWLEQLDRGDTTDSQALPRIVLL